MNTITSKRIAAIGFIVIGIVGIVVTISNPGMLIFPGAIFIPMISLSFIIASISQINSINKNPDEYSKKDKITKTDKLLLWIVGIFVLILIPYGIYYLLYFT